jgi:hypothetical protein
MTPKDSGSAADISRSAYDIAWQDFCALPNLTPDEKASGPLRLRWYIRIMVEVGERDPAKIAKAAMGMLREYEQILRSQARVESVTHSAESAHSQ